MDSQPVAGGGSPRCVGLEVVAGECLPQFLFFFRVVLSCCSFCPWPVRVGRAYHDLTPRLFTHCDFSSLPRVTHSGETHLWDSEELHEIMMVVADDGDMHDLPSAEVLNMGTRNGHYHEKKRALSHEILWRVVGNSLLKETQALLRGCTESGQFPRPLGERVAD